MKIRGKAWVGLIDQTVFKPYRSDIPVKQFIINRYLRTGNLFLYIADTDKSIRIGIYSVNFSVAICVQRQMNTIWKRFGIQLCVELVVIETWLYRKFFFKGLFIPKFSKDIIEFPIRFIREGVLRTGKYPLIFI